jgi:LacI family transcriptional regulator
VARRADVSVGTVSNVLNGTSRVSDERRKRVLQAVEALGYSQNLLAQGLRKRRSTMVGLCVPHTSVAYFSALVNAFEELASARGYELMQVLSHRDPKQELKRVDALLRYKIGGLILVPTINPAQTLKLVQRSGTPLVVVDRATTGQRLDQVTFDNRGAMFDAARQLIALGHRRILFLMRERELIVVRQRIAGLQAAAKESPEKVHVEIQQCEYDSVAITARLRKEFAGPHPPTAIIASNSAHASWCLRAFRALKINYPREVSLLCFDEPDWADIVTPALSVVRQPTEAIARKAWEFLIRRMTDEAKNVQREELRAEVIFRESVEPVRPLRVVR